MRYIGLSHSAPALRVALAALLVFGLAAAPWWAGSAHAMSGPGEDGTASANVWQQAEDDLVERPPELPYLFAVFAITWAGFFAYSFYMARRRREVEREVEALKRALQESDRSAPRPE